MYDKGGNMLHTIRPVSYTHLDVYKRQTQNDETVAVQSAANLDTVTFGTGCFWCTEAVFQQVEGVISVESGYAGGHVDNPTYEQVGTGATGHAECLNCLLYTSRCV